MYLDPRPRLLKTIMTEMSLLGAMIYVRTISCTAHVRITALGGAEILLTEGDDTHVLDTRMADTMGVQCKGSGLRLHRSDQLAVKHKYVTILDEISASFAKELEVTIV